METRFFIIIFLVIVCIQLRKTVESVYLLRCMNNLFSLSSYQLFKQMFFIAGLMKKKNSKGLFEFCFSCSGFFAVCIQFIYNLFLLSVM